MRCAALFLVFIFGCGVESAQTDRPTDTTEDSVRAQKQTPPPSSDEAKSLVANSPEFSEYQFTNAAYTLPMQQNMMTTPAREIAAKLAKAGWIGMDGDGRVVLTQKAESDKRFLVRPNGVVDIVPLARKELTIVEAVRTSPEGQPLVDFRWEWQPNEIGVLFDPRYSGEQYATATLMWDGSQWAVLRIRPRETP